MVKTECAIDTQQRRHGRGSEGIVLALQGRGKGIGNDGRHGPPSGWGLFGTIGRGFIGVERRNLARWEGSHGFGHSAIAVADKYGSVIHLSGLLDSAYNLIMNRFFKH